MAERVGVPFRRLMRDWGAVDIAFVRALRQLEGEEADRRELEGVHKTRQLPGG